MKRSLIKVAVVFLSLIVIPSCFKEDDGREREQELLRQYLAANNITVSPTASGLYYIEQEEGTGPAVEAEDYLIINYTAQLIGGLVYDTTDSTTAATHNIYYEEKLYGPYKFAFSRVSIQGVREGISYMKEGGVARLIIPSDLGFGAYSIGNIPSYSTLIYDIELLEVIKDPIAHEAALLEAYLLDNNITVDSLASGLYYIEEIEGTGEVPQSGQTCVVTFTGKLLDGRVFAKVTDEKPYNFQFGVTQIIEGFEEGVSFMKPGGKATFIIPSKIGYGSLGSPDGKISPYSTLVYDVELKQVN